MRGQKRETEAITLKARKLRRDQMRQRLEGLESLLFEYQPPPIPFSPFMFSQGPPPPVKPLQDPFLKKPDVTLPDIGIKRERPDVKLDDDTGLQDEKRIKVDPDEELEKMDEDVYFNPNATHEENLEDLDL